MKPYTQLSIFTVLLASFSMVLAGNLDSPADPSVPGSAMYNLEDVYNRLNDGTEGAKRTGGFTEPNSGPASTGHSLNQVMTKAPVKDDTNGAEPSEVANGKTYWGLTGGNWGPQTGTYTGGGTCSGTLNGTRWCDNGNGTVTDLTTGLVWLQNANWGGERPFWVNSIDGENAHDRAASLKNGANGADDLSDGSNEGDWRLPTKNELLALVNGVEPVSSSIPGAFSGVQASGYWSSTTYADNANGAWSVYLVNGVVYYGSKTNDNYVWPVRGGQ